MDMELEGAINLTKKNLEDKEDTVQRKEREEYSVKMDVARTFSEN